jgi:hypothetical protein
MNGIFPPDFDKMDAVIRERTVARLKWRYGPERAAKIASGEDALTNLDIAKWRALGARGDAA